MGENERRDFLQGFVCSMNPDRRLNNCNVKQETPTDEHFTPTQLKQLHEERNQRAQAKKTMKKEHISPTNTNVNLVRFILFFLFFFSKHCCHRKKFFFFFVMW